MSRVELANISRKNRIAHKQTTFVVLLAFGLGLIFSFTQIYVDYLKQSDKLSDTILQVISTMKQPATEAAYHLDPNLANQVGQGLFEYAPIVSVRLFGNIGDINNRQDLVTLKRPLETRQDQWISSLLFGDKQTHKINLFREGSSKHLVGLLVIESDPYSIASAFIERSLNVIVFGILRTGIFAVIILSFFFRTVTKPLSDLSNKLSLINPEDPIKQRLAVTKLHENDEFGQLAISANRYLTSVDQHLTGRREAEEALKLANEVLEDRVKSRTYQLETEIEGRVKAEHTLFQKTEIMSLLKQIAVIANEADSFDDAVQHTLLTIGKNKNWPVAHAYTLANNDHDVLVPTRLWYMKDSERYDEFRRVTESLFFKRGQGLPGRVWESGEPTWITDVTEDNNFPRATLLKKLNVVSACAFPVLVRWKVVAVLEFFSPERLESNEALLDAMRDIGIQLGRVVERERAAEKLTAAKDDAEAANKAKSVFLANMSHEVRTPINGVFGLIQVLERSKLDPDQNETVKLLRNSTVILTAVIDDILDFSKVEAGEIKLESITFKLRPVLESVAALMKPKAQEKTLALSLDISQDVPDLLIGDPVRLQQILINLVNNAIKFTESGYVLIRVSYSKSQKPKTGLLFEVCDTGCGLSTKQQESLFQPFVQADNSKTRRFGGTGLGLSICSKLAELFDGEIGVESQPDQGSRFWCTLYFEEACQDDSVVSYQPVSQPPVLHMLVVEDNPINMKVAVSLLKDEGHQVISATNGEQALNILDSNNVNAVLMDVHMPSMDGFEVTRRIRALNTETSKVPIIMLSADAMETSRTESLDAGASGFIAKPFELSQVNQVLVELFGLRSPSKADCIKLIPSQVSQEKGELPFININALDGMKKSLGLELVTELIGDFSEQSERSIKALEIAILGGDMLSIREITHSLKGSARELKATQVTQLLEQIENINEVSGVKKKLGQLAACLKETLQAYDLSSPLKVVEKN